MDFCIYKESKKVSFLKEVNERIGSYQGRVQENRLAHDIFVIHHNETEALGPVCDEIQAALTQSLIKWNIIRFTGTLAEKSVPEIFLFFELDRIFRKAKALGLYPRNRLASWIIGSGAAFITAGALCWICLLAFPDMHLKSALLSPVFLANTSWLSPVAAWGALSMYEKRVSRNPGAQKKLATLLTETGTAPKEAELVSTASNQLFYSPVPIAVILPRLNELDGFSSRVLHTFLKDTEKQDLFMIRTLWVLFEQEGRTDVSKLLAEMQVLGKSWKGNVMHFSLKSPAESLGKAA